MEFMELPAVMIENIFSYLTYDEIARNRLVCRAVNDVCMRLLNRGFTLIERHHAMSLKCVKSQLPRRESERRYHHLSRHCDILTSIETRISMLNMTYSKFIDNGLCCFIPGKVIDEIRRVLKMVEYSPTPPRAHEVLQELRDISSMAIEHFDDKVSPALRKLLQQGTVQPASKQPNMLASLALRQEMAVLRKRSVLNKRMSMFVANQYKTFFKQMTDYKKVVYCQRKYIRDLTKKQRDQDNSIADLKRRIEECDIKYSELTHTNQAVGVKAIVSAAGEMSASTSSQPLHHFSSQIKLDLSVMPIGTSKRNNKRQSNIKPRKAVIKLPSLSEDSGPPAKLPKLQESRLSPAPPSTSGKLSPRTRSQCSLAKIRGITNEIRQINNITKTIDGHLKRRNGGELYVPDSKKQKYN